MHNKLQTEKARLVVAVQACEAAAASVSRPSSPLDTAPPPIPLRELQTRARLEDLIDQVSNSFFNVLYVLNVIFYVVFFAFFQMNVGFFYLIFLIIFMH